MFTLIFYGGIVLALMLIWIEYKCAVSNKKFYAISKSIWWNRVYKWRYFVAFVLVPFLILEYPVYVDGERYLVFGFPLMAAAFDSSGRDFVSALTGIFLLIDAIILYFSIHILLCIFKRWAIKKMTKKEQ